MFPGAHTAPDDAAYAIVGAPLDRSTTFYPGTRFGPDLIRRVAYGFEDYDHHTDQQFSDLDVSDHGDVRPWQDAPAYLSFLSGELGDYVDRGTVPVVLGGEHTVSVAGVRATDPSVYVAVDAHLDLRPSFDEDPWSHATVSHHVTEVVDEVVLLGVRAGARAEWERARETDTITAIAPDAVADWIESEVPTRPTYLSIDIDGVDPAYAPGTGTPEPFGLAPTIVRDLVRAVAPVAVGFDVVEVNDRDDGQAATMAAKLVRSFVYTHATADV